jgi:hypothetical protein
MAKNIYGERIQGNLDVTSVTASFSGSFVGAITGTASYANQALSSSYSLSSSYAITASYALQAVSSSYAVTASYFAGTVNDLGTNPVTVAVATTTVLPNTPVYGNGVLGVGAFLSGSANGVLGSIDSILIQLGDRILVKNQVNQITNGVYEATSTGSASSKYRLTRTTDSDETSELDTQIVIIATGSSNQGLIFSQQTDNPVVGTNNISYNTTSTGNYVTQRSVGTQTIYNIPVWWSSARQLTRGTTDLQFNPTTKILKVSGSLIVTGSSVISNSVTASKMLVSSSGVSQLTVIGSGSSLPLFTVQGSQGELFSITDSLSGSLFSVNDISGLPILEVFSDNTTLIGDYQDPMFITTKKVTMTNSGSFVVYSLPTASYDTAFYDYSIRSGSNARAGQIMAIQSGSSVRYTETVTTDFGNTSKVTLSVTVSGSNMVLSGSAATGSWTTKCIIRGL